MKTRISMLLVVYIVCILTLSGCVSQSKYDALQNELNSAKVEIALLQTQLSSVQDELSSTRTTLEQTKNDLIAVQNSLKDTQQALADAQSKINLYSERLGITVYSDIQPNYYKVNNILITLVNNASATDPTWQELQTFLSLDKTDQLTYIPGIFMCGGFAEIIHNNAENAGIKAALVGIEFVDRSEGHALNAFKTTDKGLVYIDCTGKGLQLLQPGVNQISPSSWDKIAYVAKDKEYGALSIVNNNSFEYSFYEKERAKWNIYRDKLDAYNADVAKFKAETAGKTYYIGTPQWYKIKQWEASLTQQLNELKSLEASLIWNWEPLGVVSRIEIWW